MVALLRAQEGNWQIQKLKTRGTIPHEMVSIVPLCGIPHPNPPQSGHRAHQDVGYHGRGTHIPRGSCGTGWRLAGVNRWVL